MDKGQLQKILEHKQVENLSDAEIAELIWLTNAHLYKERPVTIQEFIHSTDFVKKKWPNIYPIWKNTLSEIFPNPFSAPYNEILISAAAGAGKAQPLYANILTPEGYKKMKDIKLGQLVFDGSGKLCQVTGIYPQGKRKVFEIKFNDNTCIQVSDEHINHVYYYANNKKQVINITTLELISELKKNKYYVDTPVLEWTNTPPFDYFTIERNIPKVYLYSSSKTRTKLLDRLSVDNTFVTTEEQLSNDFDFLVRSLGYVNIIEKQGNVYKHFFDNNMERQIKSIRQIGFEECQCIMVDSPLHTYITDNITPTHNTVTATVSILYDMYKLGCLKDPCTYYGLGPGTMLIFAIFSATGTTAAVNWNDITQGIEMCPWINDKVVDRRGLEKKNGSLVPVEILPGIYIQTGSKFQHSMGKAIFDGLMDEAAFGGDNIKEAQKTYNELSSRMATRFRSFSKKGDLPGQLFLISSPKEAGDFMQYRIDKALQAESSRTLIKRNISSWDANPSNDSDDKFTVFVGNEYKEPKIFVTEEDGSPDFEDMDYLIYPPTSYLDEFKKDILGSIMNYGGVTTIADTGLFKSPSLLNEAMVLQNPFNSNTIKIPFDKNDKQLMDFMDMDYFKDIRHPESNRFIHIDIAFSSNTLDRYGIAAGYCTLNDRNIFTEIAEGTSKAHDVFTKAEKTFYIDWALGIEPYPGQEIPLSKVRDFIFYLMQKLNYPVASISGDTFQSKQTLQDFEQQHYKTESISVDRSRDPYLFLRQLISNKQLLLPKHDELKKELLQLRDTGKKVDHPIGGCFTGNTKIILGNGTTTTLKQLADLGPQNKFKVLSCTKDGVVCIADAYNAHKTKRTMDLVSVYLTNGSFMCTPEHLIMLSNGTYKQAQDLTETDTLMSITPTKVLRVNYIKQTHDVYDITVPVYENFLLDTGVFVHNSKDISDAVAGCIWNCANSTNIISVSKITQAVLNPHMTPTQFKTASEAELKSMELIEFERMRNAYSSTLFKGL